MSLRILIADRNARLLESVSRTFAPQFSIQTATTQERCNELLRGHLFGLAVISEKLADVPGLHLLGQIARNSPGTLRVLAARKSRLELLDGKLGPFGLFRTLSYPIDPQELLCVLSLAGISLTSADAMFATNVPMTIASMPRVRRSNSSSAPRVAPVAPAAPRPAASPPPAARSAASQSQRIAPRVSPQAAPTLQLVPTRRPGSSLQPAPSLPAESRSAAPPRLSPPSEMFELIGERREPVNRVGSRPSHRQPVPTKLVLGATIAAVFLATTLTLHLLEARAHVTRASTPRPEIAQADIPAPPPSPAPGLTTPFSPAPSVAKRAAPKPVAADPDDEPENAQIAASTTTPIADPSTFGSEAYEPIYSN